MTAKEVRQKYLEYFEKNGHTIISSASLIPKNDSSTLFISSGMQPLVQYLLGEKHPAGQRLVNSQKCFRSEDIDEVGDGRHNTFFEMLGNWSLGDYFKHEELPWLFNFLIQEVGLDPNRLYVTVFRGNEDLGLARDTESVVLWQQIFAGLGIVAKDVDFPEDKGLQDGKIFYYNEKKNWWSRSGVPQKMPVGEIGGGDSEIFYDLGAGLLRHENSQWKDQPCHVNCDCGRFIEIGNSVFIEYKKTEQGFEKLANRNVDFGGGLERITMVSQGKTSVYETDLFERLLNKISALSGGKKYADFAADFEVIADHLKSATFVMGDDSAIAPANTDQGYMVRRLLRRAIRYGKKLGIDKQNWTVELAQEVIAMYSDVYEELVRNKQFVIDCLIKEEDNFKKTLDKGIERIEKLFSAYIGQAIDFSVDAKTLFDLYQSYGFPVELSFEEINRLRVEHGGQAISAEAESELLVAFKTESEAHRDLSRTASAGKFKGGLADSSQETTRLHTAAHLLLAALRQVLGDHVMQKGSNITAERLRYDFSHPEKMTDEQKRAVEDLVNEAIKAQLPVVVTEMDLAQAKESGATGVFESKYGERVKVYKMGNFSNEICGGPHVNNTAELGRFEIQKEEASSAGVRRIKAVLK
ncbi:MAG: alanine--tRNA ligase [Candidatus Falkowbacteria bacterium]